MQPKAFTTKGYGKSDVIAEHIMDYTRKGALLNNNWMDVKSKALQGGYNLIFIEHAEWKSFVTAQNASVENHKYFGQESLASWSLVELEKLRQATLAEIYRIENASVAPPNAEYDAEMLTFDGKANRIFVWRLIVVHLRMLKKMEERAPGSIVLTSCFDMDALVDNVAHMLKYRRCIQKAKWLYKNAGSGSLHEQYRAKLLNVQHAHHHQDEDVTDIGIARRIIRQAHVANYRHHHCPPFNDYDANENLTEMADADAPYVCLKTPYKFIMAEQHFTNPPMAPIMCSAPPRMGKSALSLLMVSFASKLGAHIVYGVSPNKVIPKKDIENKIDSMKWVGDGDGAQKMAKIFVYSQDVTGDIKEMNQLIHNIASNPDAWTFHVRDEAQTLVKEANTKMRYLMQDSLPIFYGLSMCVSATLLPVFAEREVVGSVDSLLDPFHKSRAGVDARSVLEKNVVLQNWSFPIAPDFLAPPKSAFPLSPPPANESGLAMDNVWYKQYYEITSAGETSDNSGTTIPRTTHYYGTHFHIKKWEGAHLESTKLLLDNTLEHSRSVCYRKLTKVNARKFKSSAYDLKRAYTECLKTFNAINTYYFGDLNEYNDPKWHKNGPKRVGNQPILNLTVDSNSVLNHAQKWLEEMPINAMPAQDADNGAQAGTSTNPELHPMLIMAPAREKAGKNGRQEWAVLLCKLAWLRLYKDSKNSTKKEDFKKMTKDELKAKYGICVLVYSDARAREDFVNIVCNPDDFTRHETLSSAVVAVVTFDPTLPENRFSKQVTILEREDLPEGTMLPSVLLPALDEDIYTLYAKHIDEMRGEGQEPKNATEFLSSKDAEKHFIKTYTFDDGTHYGVSANKSATSEDFDEDGEDGEDGEGGDDADDADDADGGDGEDGEDADAAEDSDNETSWHIALGGIPLSNKKVNSHDDSEDEDTEGEEEDAVLMDLDVAFPIEDMNAIVLRLCVTVVANAQDAVKFVSLDCGIFKIAAMGYAMFRAGLTLQTTLESPSEGGGETEIVHMFVPKYISLWLSTAKDGPDLSYLYQLVGRGFVDTKKYRLPEDWKLEMCSQETFYDLIRDYGNAELMVSMVHNESLAGRMVTLGDTLYNSFDLDNNRLMLDKKTSYASKRLKGESSKNTLNSALFPGDYYPKKKPEFHPVFSKLRSCLNGFDWITKQAETDLRSTYGQAVLSDNEEHDDSQCKTITLTRNEVPVEERLVFLGDGHYAGGHTLDDANVSTGESGGGEESIQYSKYLSRNWKGWSIFLEPEQERVDNASMDRAEKRAVADIADRKKQAKYLGRGGRSSTPRPRPTASTQQQKAEEDILEFKEDIDARDRCRASYFTRSRLADMIVSAEGAKCGFLKWYVKALQAAQDEVLATTGSNRRLVQEPHREQGEKSYAKSLHWIKAYIRVHGEVLRNSHAPWVCEFCFCVRESFLVSADALELPEPVPRPHPHPPRSPHPYCTRVPQDDVFGKQTSRNIMWNDIRSGVPTDDQKRYDLAHNALKDHLAQKNGGKGGLGKQPSSTGNDDFSARRFLMQSAFGNEERNKSASEESSRSSDGEG